MKTRTKLRLESKCSSLKPFSPNSCLISPSPPHIGSCFSSQHLSFPELRFKATDFSWVYYFVRIKNDFCMGVNLRSSLKRSVSKFVGHAGEARGAELTKRLTLNHGEWHQLAAFLSHHAAIRFLFRGFHVCTRLQLESHHDALQHLYFSRVGSALEQPGTEVGKPHVQ